MDWFTVDKAGLAAQLEKRGKAFAVFELIANAWDSGTPRVDVSLKPIEGEAYATLTVEDYSPDGFINLDDAFTMFGRSTSGASATKRGRFALGEKLVLSLCREATISSTSGSVEFTADGRRRKAFAREKGTAFVGEIKMTRAELADVEAAVARLIPHVPTTFNGLDLKRPAMLKQVNARLQTEITDDDGILRRGMRDAIVTIYPADDGEPGEILEMGVPVVECDLGYRVDVSQKIPLGVERDNVPPSFLKALRVVVLNAMHEQLDEATAASPWVSEAMGDARVQPAAFSAVIKSRFGERAVVAVPGDPSANAQAEAAGFQVIHGGALSGDAWGNARKFAAMPTSSAVFPSASAAGLAAARDAADVAVERLLVQFASALASALPYDNGAATAVCASPVEALAAIRAAMKATGVRIVPG